MSARVPTPSSNREMFALLDIITTKVNDADAHRGRLTTIELNPALVARLRKSVADRALFNECLTDHLEKQRE